MSAKRTPRNGSSIQGAALLLPLLAVGGCSRSPSFNLLGSYFPSWIVCLGIGALVTLVTHRVLSQRKLLHELWPLPVVYPALFLFVTCTLWLCFFS